MEFEPIVIKVDPPRRGPFKHLPKLPHLGPRGNKLLLAASAIVMSASLIGIVSLSILVSNENFRQQHGLDLNVQDRQLPQTSGTTISKAASPGGGAVNGIGGFTGTNSPVITLTANPASVSVGQTSKIIWSATNNPTGCTASDDWSGGKATSGEENTARLNKVQTYLFTLTCKNATGTSFSTVSVGAIAQGGTGNIATRPSVTLAANPAAVYRGDSSTLTWSVGNSPSSCTASGDWSGAKNIVGPASTGPLTANKTYTYTLTCANNAGTGYATATVLVADPPANANANTPLVSLSSAPVSPVAPGTAVKLSWSASNSPSSCTASGDWSGAKSASGSETVGPLTTQKTYNFTLTCANGYGGSFDSAAILVIPSPPSVSLAASPSSILAGNSSTLTWSASNSPSSCTASGDWSGAKSASGSQSSGALNTAKTYYYTLTCTNAGGTGYARNVPVTVNLPAAPVVSVNVNPISLTTGGSAAISWSATNSPSSCTASGDWSGAKSASGSQSSGALNTARTYSYTLQCSNAGGSNSATASVSVASGNTAVKPGVTIAVNPTAIGTGSSTTISWTASNSPTSCTASGSWSGAKSASGSQSSGTISTAGNYTYTLSCSNAAGTTTASASLTVIATPSISLSVSPSSITSGSSATLAWSVGNSPSSCTAGGSWSGSKGFSGSQSTGTVNSAGTYSYTLSCSNSGGTTSKSVSLTVSAPASVYCAGRTPCYGPADLANHASAGNCWGWNKDWVINITTFRPDHPGGIKSGSTSTIENASAVCDHDIAAILAGTASIPGYRDDNGNTTYNHNSSTKSNSSGSGLAAYRVGYYDAAKP